MVQSHLFTAFLKAVEKVFFIYVENFHFLCSCNTSLLCGPVSAACNLQEVLRLFNSGCSYQFTSIPGTSFPCCGKQQWEAASGSSAVRYQQTRQLGIFAFVTHDNSLQQLKDCIFHCFSSVQPALTAWTWCSWLLSAYSAPS